MMMLVHLLTPLLLGEDQRDLKWVEAVIVLFSSGVLDTLVTLLDKFSETFLPSWGQQVSLSVTNAGILCTLVSLTLKVDTHHSRFLTTYYTNLISMCD